MALGALYGLKASLKKLHIKKKIKNKKTAHGVGRVVGAFGSGTGFAGSMLN